MPRKCRGSANEVPRKCRQSAGEVPRKGRGSANEVPTASSQQPTARTTYLPTLTPPLWAVGWGGGRCFPCNEKTKIVIARLTIFNIFQYI